MRDKIEGILQKPFGEICTTASGVFSGYQHSPKVGGQFAKQILDIICEEIEKELLTYEEMDKAYCLADLHKDTLGHEAVAQAQLDKILALLKGGKEMKTFIEQKQDIKGEIENLEIQNHNLYDEIDKNETKIIELQKLLTEVGKPSLKNGG